VIDEELSKVFRKLTQLGFCFVAVIDSGEHEDVSREEVVLHIQQGTIFEFLGRFTDIAGWGLGSLSDDDKRHLLGEWQSLANAVDSHRKFGVSRNGICLLSAYIIEGIQMRTFTKKIWPGPDPS